MSAKPITSDRSLTAQADGRAQPMVVLTMGAGMRTDMDIRSHHVVADEPVASGGSDQGAAPRELLAAALGSCTSITLRMYADRKGWPLDDVVIRVWHRRVDEKDPTDPAGPAQRIDVFESELELGGDLTDDQRARLLEIAGRCPVKKTLEGRSRISTILVD